MSDPNGSDMSYRIVVERAEDVVAMVRAPELKRGLAEANREIRRLRKALEHLVAAGRVPPGDPMSRKADRKLIDDFETAYEATKRRVKFDYCGTCGAPMGPEGMIPICKISGEQCVECCSHDRCGGEKPR